ncbi:MAG: calcium/sodium antiporter [Candidatus Lernaella stagnicola]|nr:calcium/sodium antiporter [Candidatus Lernaella stagnicola]
MLIQFGIFIGGLIALALGAEILVYGGLKIARVFKLSPLLVGLTILAYGTSLPELVVSVLAAVKGSAPIALGNAVGSNLLNTGLILGIAALIFPLAATPSLFRRDLPLHLLVVVLFGLLAFDGRIDLYDGTLFLLAMCSYLSLTVWNGLRHPEDVPELPEGETKPKESWWIAVILIFAGSVGLFFGANWMVDAAINIARELNIAERVIGTTIVALGTSLPELATTIAAARRNESSLVLGNLIGSNIFNLLLIVGTAGVIAPFSFNEADARVDFLFLIANAVMLFCLFRFREPRTMERPAGSLLIIVYALFLALLFFRI